MISGRIFGGELTEWLPHEVAQHHFYSAEGSDVSSSQKMVLGSLVPVAALQTNALCPNHNYVNQ
jgi:hypothetical protein